MTLERIDAAATQSRRPDPGWALSLVGDAGIAQRNHTASGSFFWSTRLLRSPRRKAMRS